MERITVPRKQVSYSRPELDGLKRDPVPSAFPERSLKIEGVTISYIDTELHYGNNPLLLIHGGILGSKESAWASNIGPLSSIRRVIAMDLPGYGQSGELPGKPSMQYYIDFIELFMKELKLENADITGHSLGGGIAVGFALQQPALVGRLAAVDAYGFYKPLSVIAHIIENLPAAFGFLEQIAQGEVHSWYEHLVAKRFLKNKDDLESNSDIRSAFIRFMESEIKIEKDGGRLKVRFATDYTRNVHLLGSEQIMTLFIHGGKDPLFPEAQLKRAAKRVSGSEFVEFETAGHAPQQDYPEQFNTVLKYFLCKESQRPD